MQRVGAYELVEEVARGGMGAVWRARCPDGRPAALKLLLAGAEASPQQRRRFEAEVEALRRVGHPHLIALLDAGEHEGAPFLVMEWVEGETLAARLEREGPFDPRDAVALVERLAEALAHCHAQGLLHRDLKPENVLLRAGSGEPLLTDFGMVRDLGGGVARMTATGQWIGTPGYWPPEQARGERHAVGPRSDVYGLGALLYAALTARPVHQGSSLLEIVQSIARTPPAPGKLRPGVPAWLDAVCLSALDPDPARRPADAAAFAAALGRRGPPGHRPGGRALGLAGLGLTLLAAAVGLRSAAPPAPASSPQAPVVSAGESAGIFERGLERQAQGDQAGALADFQRTLALEPESPRAHYCRGHALQLKGDLAGAVADYEQALALDPGFKHALNNLGFARHLQGDHRAGLELLDRAIAVDPGYATALYNRGIVRRALGDAEGAIQDFERAVQLRPGLALAWHNLGAVLHRGRGDARAAIGCYDRALELDPGMIEAWVNRGVLKRELNDLRGALEDYDRALALDPRHPIALYNRGSAWQARGDLRRAIADFDLALEHDPQYAAALTNRGHARQRLGDPRGALEDFERALALDPDALAFNNRGQARMELKDWSGARADFDRALELDPSFAVGWFNRAILRRHTGDRVGARADLERALELGPREPWARQARDALAGLR